MATPLKNEHTAIRLMRGRGISSVGGGCAVGEDGTSGIVVSIGGGLGGDAAALNGAPQAVQLGPGICIAPHLGQLTLASIGPPSSILHLARPRLGLSSASLSLAPLLSHY